MKSELVCAFCWKTNEDVAILIASPCRSVFICDECVARCNAMVFERLAEYQARARALASGKPPE
jgi:ATP-dependent protease Clp ATPase subunit